MKLSLAKMWDAKVRERGPKERISCLNLGCPTLAARAKIRRAFLLGAFARVVDVAEACLSSISLPTERRMTGSCDTSLEACMCCDVSRRWVSLL